MRPSNKSRSRNKSGSSSQRRGNVGNVVNRVFESAGPDGKVRGTPQQVIEKYQGLARDAQVSGDRVAAENYLQHAEHYARLLGEAQRQTQEARQERDDRDGQRDEDQRDHVQDQRPEADDRPQRRAPALQPEPAGLTTFGDDRRDDAGPVETPESAAWSAQSDDEVSSSGGGERIRSESAANGEHREAPQEAAPAPQDAAPAPQDVTSAAQDAAPAAQDAVKGEGTAPKRPRRRRTTKQAAPVAEAPAD